MEEIESQANVILLIHPEKSTRNTNNDTAQRGMKRSKDALGQVVESEDKDGRDGDSGENYDSTGSYQPGEGSGDGQE